MQDDLIVYGWGNLQFLCIECHNAVHGRTDEGRRMAFDADGNLIGFEESDTPPHIGGKKSVLCTPGAAFL